MVGNLDSVWKCEILGVISTRPGQIRGIYIKHYKADTFLPLLAMPGYHHRYHHK